MRDAAVPISPVVAIVQARMSSTRLPGKVLREVCGQPILHHVVRRLRSAALVDRVVVATSTEPSDDAIERWCSSNGVDSHRGSLEDVLNRFLGAAEGYGARTVVRITADCPLIDPFLVDFAIKEFSTGLYDYVSTEDRFPDGLDTEVFSIEALRKAEKEAGLQSEREHVTPYIWKNPAIFSLSKVRCKADLSAMRWTVDDERDLRFVTEVLAAFRDADWVFSMVDVLTFLSERPEVIKINSGTARNEGYAKSLKDDKDIAV